MPATRGRDLWIFAALLTTMLGSAALAGPLSFGPQQTLDSDLNGAWEAIGADLDSDGDSDVLAINVFTSLVVWYENADGEGTFSGRRTIGDTVPSAVGVTGGENLVMLPRSPEITVTPDSVEFGEVDLDEPAMETFTILNEGDALLEIMEITLVLPTNGLPTGFTLVSNEINSLAPGMSHEVGVIFDPWRLGLEDAPVMIESNDADEPITEFFVSGHGVQDAPDLVGNLLGLSDPMPPLEATDHNGDGLFDCADIVTCVNAGH